MKSLMKVLIGVLGLAALSAAGLAGAQTPHVLELNGRVTITPEGIIPSLTWNTSPAGAVCTATGGWTGTKAASGNEGQPAVRKTTAYHLSCTWAGAPLRLGYKWTPPTTNDDGSPLTDLAGFKLYYGKSPTMSVNTIKDIPGAGVTSVEITEGLSVGTWYGVLSAVNSAGIESAKSSPITSKVLTSPGGASVGQTFHVTVPEAPTNVTVE